MWPDKSIVWVSVWMVALSARTLTPEITITTLPEATVWLSI